MSFATGPLLALMAVAEVTVRTRREVQERAWILFVRRQLVYAGGWNHFIHHYISILVEMSCG